MLKTSLLFVASLISSATLLAGAAAPTVAAPLEAKSRIVSYADLDLGSAAGRDRLEARIDRAVRAVCGRASVKDLNALDQVLSCRAEALEDANAQLRRGEVFIAVAQPIVFTAQ